MIGNVLLCLPNHVNGNHVVIYRWLDGRGWSINAGDIHVEGFSIDEVVTNFQKYIHENNYEIVDEVVGYCLRGGKPATSKLKTTESEYFY